MYAWVESFQLIAYPGEIRRQRLKTKMKATVREIEAEGVRGGFEWEAVSMAEAVVRFEGGGIR